jgi:ParB family chromosome partitioning protein
MEEALIIAEFEGNETALEKLNDAHPNQLRYVAARIKRDEQEAAEYAELTAPYAAQGFAILPRDFYRPDEPEYISSETLTTAEGEAVDMAAHIVAHAPVWAVRLGKRHAYVHIHSGDVIDDDKVDEEAAEDEPAAEGYVHSKLVKWQEIWHPSYYTKEAEALGLLVPEGLDHGSTGPDAEAKARETEERRKTVELNKRGLAAQDVRREWVAGLLSRRTAPKGSVVFVGGQLARHRDLLNRNKAAQTAAELFGQTDAAVITNQATALEDTGDSRATMLLLGQVLGALEALTPKSAWSAKPGTWSYQPHSRDYLTFLAAQGYPLSDIERVITGEQDQDTLYATIAAEKAAEREAVKASKKAAKASGPGEVATREDTAAADLRPEDIEAQEATEAEASEAASVA